MDKVMSTPAAGYTYREIVQLLFDPSVTLPPLAVIYTTDIDEAEAAGYDHIVFRAEGLARGKGKTKGLHAREVEIPLHVARRLAYDSYADYLAALAVRRAADAGETAISLGV